MFASTKAAIAAAAKLCVHLDVPSRAPTERVQQSRRGDRGLEVIAVRAALRRAGVDPDGDEAQLLYRWATTTDERDEFDDLLEAVDVEGYELAHQLGVEGRRRLARLVEHVAEQLEVDEVVQRPPKLERIPVAWRVHEDERGRRTVHLTTDPAPDDPRSREHAHAIALGHVAGPITPRTGGVSLRAEDWLPRWQGGEWRNYSELDKAIAEHAGISTRQAARHRARWGLTTGTRGRPRK